MKKIGTALVALGATTMTAVPALAQTAPAAPNLSGISDALGSGLSSGQVVLIACAAPFVLFAVVWMIIRKVGALGKAG